MKWAVCIITTNAAPPNTHPMRRHRIDCLQKNRRLRVVVRRRPDLCATRHFDESSKEAPAHMLLPSSRTFGFFVGTIDQEPPGTLMPTPTCIRSEARDENQSPIHLSTQSCSLGTLLHRSNRFSTFVNLILICDSDGQPCHDGRQSFKSSPINGFCTSTYRVTSKGGFPQKGGFA